jgi:hypothetical protein
MISLDDISPETIQRVGRALHSEEYNQAALKHLTALVLSVADSWHTHNKKATLSDFDNGMMRAYASVLARALGVDTVKIEARLAAGWPNVQIDKAP